MKNRRVKQIIVVLFLTTLFLGLTGVTFSYFQNTGTMTNEFQAGDFSTSATETFVSPSNWLPGDETQKTLIVKNEGDIAQGVRIKIVESWKDSNNQDLPLEVNGVKAAIINLDNTEDWERDGEYYYYKEVLDPGDETSSFIKSVTFNKDIVTDPVCTTTNGITSCENTYNGYENATYTITFIIQTIQYEFMDPEWDEDRGTLYAVLRDEYRSNSGFARLYSGSHQDSMDPDKSNKKIYHWYGSNDANGTAILNKNNVIFAGHCWQMIRTTDTGGVRLLYNGEPTITVVDGETHYDCGQTRPGHIGGIKSTYNLSGSKYYASAYTTSVSGTTTTYTLVDPTTINVTSSDAANQINDIVTNYPYVCPSGTSCTTLYKVDSQSNGITANVYASTYRDAIGISSFNSNNNSIADVGYMYNSRYVISSASISSSYTMLSPVTLNSSNLTTYGNCYFGDSYTMSGNNHVLTNPVKGNTITDYPSSWVGKYMCQSSSNSSCGTVYYINSIRTSGTNPIIYKAEIASGKEYNDSSYKYLFGDSIVDNVDGTFEIKDNIEEVIQKDWGTEYSTKVNKYVCMPGYYTYDSVNNKYICSDGGSQKVGALRYITETKTTNFTATSIYKYGFGIESYNSSYRLIGNNNEDGTLQYIYNWPNTSTTNCFTTSGDTISNCGYETLSKSHYTCYNLTGICNQYYYITTTSDTQMNLTSISNGKYVSTDLTDINNILYIMLYQDDENGNVNTTNSKIKENIDSWYQNILLINYDNYIDDTIYCNNRGIKEISGIKQFGGWNPNGGTTDTNYELKFNEYNVTSDLSCPNITDKFSVSNNKAHLTYKVGLISSPEMNLLNNSNIRKTGAYYWLGSPSLTPFLAFNNVVVPNGNFGTLHIGNAFGVRPAISLIKGISPSSGTGTMTNPYVIDTSDV